MKISDPSECFELVVAGRYTVKSLARLQYL